LRREKAELSLNKIMKCPRCNSVLSPVEYDGAKIEVCTGCKGEWLYAGELQKIVEHHDAVFTPEEIASLDAVNKEIFTAEKNDHDDLNCPCCENVQMEHFNYEDTSGIILHKCLECDGIWADKDQLKKIEELVDGWKADLNQDAEKYGSVLQKIEVEEQKELDRDVSISRFGFVNAFLRHFCE
jgi:Zn-finger nucleic acid-binding protein